MTHARLRLFEATGIELEYMVVDQETLEVRPIADELLKAASGSYDMSVPLGPVTWSNELAVHVIEMKVSEPTPTLVGLAALFHDHVERMNRLLAPMGAQLMPTAMHPWMDPYTEVKLWPHDTSEVYRAFDRIFDCNGHGWGNLQSMHINLPFGDDIEFGKLHAAIRLILPILPALAASSPIVDGQRTGMLDTRVKVYGENARRVPSVTGLVVPEAVFSEDDYQNEVLQRIYDDLAPLDPEGILRYEWVNARGAIARFYRNAIEIRLLDVQECPQADLAIAAAVTGAVRALVEERFASSARQRAWSEEVLSRMLIDATEHADQAVIRDAAYLRDLGFPGQAPCTLRDLWQHLVETTVRDQPGYEEWAPWFEVMWREGCLARRILRAVASEPETQTGSQAGNQAGNQVARVAPAQLRAVYRQLCECLARGQVFSASGRDSGRAGDRAGDRAARRADA